MELSSSKIEPRQILQVSASTRSRPDDQIIELVLQAFRGGGFVPHGDGRLDRPTAKVMARNSEGIRLAVEYTHLENSKEHSKEELNLQPIAAQLETTLSRRNPEREYRF